MLTIKTERTLDPYSIALALIYSLDYSEAADSLVETVSDIPQKYPEWKSIGDAAATTLEQHGIPSVKYEYVYNWVNTHFGLSQEQFDAALKTVQAYVQEQYDKHFEMVQ